MVRIILQRLGFVVICLVTGQETIAGVPDCISIAREAEKRHALPEGILQSISTVEASRIQPDGNYRAWPWTLNDSGKGLFFDNREQVLDYLDTHMTNPDTSIDIGCMQINTKWHGTFFETLDDMLDPTSNIAYAAGFLTDLYFTHGSWNDAIRHYHSSDRRKNDPYLHRVLATWTKRHSHSQDAEIQTAVFQLPFEPISTAADDAFATAIQDANNDLIRMKKEPISKPVALPVAKPITKTLAKSAPKPVITDAGTRHLVHSKENLQTAKTNTSKASNVRDDPNAEAARSSPKSADLDQRVKQRQKNLIGKWEQVLMFRAQFAAIH